MISVVLPVYNAEDKVTRAIESVLIQPEVSELIVVDDGSTDSTLERVLDYEKRHKALKCFAHPDSKNHGASATRNYGVDKTSNELIAFLDADDFYLPGRFSELVQQSAGTYDAFCSTVKKRNLDLREELVGVSSNLYENLIGGKGWVHLNGFVITKNKFYEIGGFNTSLLINQDTDLLLKVSVTCKIAYGSSNPVAMWVKATKTLSDVSTKNFMKDQGKMWRELLAWTSKSDIRETVRLDILDKSVHNFNAITRKPKSFIFRKIVLVYLILTNKAILNIIARRFYHRLFT